MDEINKTVDSLQLMKYEASIQQDLVSYLQSRQHQHQQELKDAPAQHREFLHGCLFEAGKLLQLIQKRRTDVQIGIAQLEAKAEASFQKT